MGPSVGVCVMAGVYHHGSNWARLGKLRGWAWNGVGGRLLMLLAHGGCWGGCRSRKRYREPRDTRHRDAGRERLRETETQAEREKETETEGTHSHFE